MSVLPEIQRQPEIIEVVAFKIVTIESLNTMEWRGIVN
jgi:hypothetical protein